MLFLINAVLSAAIAAGVTWLAGGFRSGGWVWQVPVVFAVSFLLVGFLLFLRLWAVCRKIDISKPQEHDDQQLRRFIRPYLQAICVLTGMRVETKGLENIPQNTRFVLAANHLSLVDVVLLLYYFPDSQIAFISKQENQTMFIVGNVMHAIMCQMINRENDREALKTILKCIQLLKDNEVSIGIFPEGYTSKDGLLHKFRPGVFKIAQKAKVPIVLCTFRNTNQVLHNAKRLRPTNVSLHLVAVVPPEELVGKTAVEISDHCHSLMAADLGSALVAAGE